MHEEISRARIDEERVKQKLEVVMQVTVCVCIFIIITIVKILNVYIIFDLKENEKLKLWREDLEKDIEMLKEEVNKAEQARAKVIYEAEKDKSESQVSLVKILNSKCFKSRI